MRRATRRRLGLAAAVAAAAGLAGLAAGETVRRHPGPEDSRFFGKDAADAAWSVYRAVDDCRHDEAGRRIAEWRQRSRSPEVGGDPRRRADFATLAALARRFQDWRQGCVAAPDGRSYLFRRPPWARLARDLFAELDAAARACDRPRFRRAIAAMRARGGKLHADAVGLDDPRNPYAGRIDMAYAGQLHPTADSAADGLRLARLAEEFGAQDGSMFGRCQPEVREQAPAFDVHVPCDSRSASVTCVLRVGDAGLAARLNAWLAPLAWADEACDLDRYRSTFAAVHGRIIALGRTVAGSEVPRLNRIRDSLATPHKVGEAMRGRHCGKFMLDANLAQRWPPRVSVRVRVPCPALLRHDGPGVEVLWCEREDRFYSEPLRQPLERAFAALAQAFAACDGKAFADAAKRAAGLPWAIDRPDTKRTQERQAELRAEYGAPRGDLLISADGYAATALRSTYSTESFRRWCALARARR